MLADEAKQRKASSQFGSEARLAPDGADRAKATEVAAKAAKVSTRAVERGTN